MGAISILLALLIPAIAPIAGFILGKYTKEELKAGRKYFVAMQHVLFVAVAAIFLYSNKWSMWVLIPGLAAVFAYLALKQFRNPFVSEALFGFAFAMSIFSNMLFIISALVFIYGLPTGSLFYRQKKGIWKSIIAGLEFAAVAYAFSFFL
jgi:hypothetical protein